jgi:hypothetical protein
MHQQTATTVLCRDCLTLFDYGREQQFFDERGWPPPVRCMGCRRARRERRLEDDALRERSTR